MVHFHGGYELWEVANSWNTVRVCIPTGCQPSPVVRESMVKGRWSSAVSRTSMPATYRHDASTLTTINEVYDKLSELVWPTERSTLDM